MKTKKRLLKFGAYLIFLTIYTIPFINWKQVNKTHSEFREIEWSVYDISKLDYTDIYDSLIVFEKRINLFTNTNPIPDSLKIGDYITKMELDSSNIQTIRYDFIGKVNSIDKFFAYPLSCQ